MSALRGVGGTALAAMLGLLLVAVPAHAGALIDRAAQQLGSDNVYVDPDASPTLSASEAQRLRDRISADGAAPMYVAVMPQRIVGETGGSPAAALLSIGRRVGRSGTYVLVAGRHMDAAATGDVLPRGEARRLRDEAIKAGNGDLSTILLGLADRIGAERRDAAAGGGGSGDGPHDGGSGIGAGGIILVGLLGAGGAALYAGRRRRRRADRAEFEEAKRNARDDLVSLGEAIRALDIDVQRPTVNPDARADYERAVNAYTRADDTWERARRPRRAGRRG